MALTPPALVAAVVFAIGEVVSPPLPGVVQKVVERAVNEMGRTLATRRRAPLTRPIAVRLLDRSQMKAARAALVEASPSAQSDAVSPIEVDRRASPLASGASGRSGSTSRIARGDSDERRRASLRSALFGHLGLLGREVPGGAQPSASVARPSTPVERPSAPVEQPSPWVERPSGPVERPSPSAGRPSPWLEWPSPSAEVTGLYDIVHQRLLVANFADVAAGRFGLARDIAQVVLDRRFDLSRWLTAPGALSFDGLLARQAVLCGDATAQALEDLDPEQGLPSPRALGAIADQVRAQIATESAGASSLDVHKRLFVELDGLSFVAHLRARASWRSVDEVWRRAPESSEQILHPEKYERADGPDDIARRLSQQLGRRNDPWRVVYGDTLGEFGTRLFLAPTASRYRVERAAAGWGGDRALLLRVAAKGNGEAGPSNTFVAWLTTWDDDTDAADFATEAIHALAALAGVRAPDDRLVAGRRRMTDARGRLFVLAHRGRAVGMLIAAPSSASAAFDHLMSAAAPAPRRTGRGARNQGRGAPR